MARHKFPYSLLKVGDQVRIPGESLEGRVVDLHPHSVEVEVSVDGQFVRRHYANESIERVPTLDEASRYIDH